MRSWGATLQRTHTPQQCQSLSECRSERLNHSELQSETSHFELCSVDPLSSASASRFLLASAVGPEIFLVLFLSLSQPTVRLRQQIRVIAVSQRNPETPHSPVDFEFDKTGHSFIRSPSCYLETHTSNLNQTEQELDQPSSRAQFPCNPSFLD